MQREWEEVSHAVGEDMYTADFTPALSINAILL